MVIQSDIKPQAEHDSIATEIQQQQKKTVWSIYFSSRTSSSLDCCCPSELEHNIRIQPFVSLVYKMINDLLIHHNNGFAIWQNRFTNV